MKMLLPIILLLIGTGAGVGAGVFLRPAPVPEAAEMDGEMSQEGVEKVVAKEEPEEADAEGGGIEREYAKLNNQFVIPVVQNGEVASLVVMALSLEVKTGFKDLVFQREPKIRDSFLQVLFDHANIGGFRGDFTRHDNIEVLRSALREVAIRDVGQQVTDVLILEIARQDY